MSAQIKVGDLKTLNEASALAAERHSDGPYLDKPVTVVAVDGGVVTVSFDEWVLPVEGDDPNHILHVTSKVTAEELSDRTERASA